MCENEVLNESILLDSLPDLKRVHLFEEIDSTSDFGKQLAKADDQFPALIYAHRQTKGRGRGDKKWISDGNSMTFSFVLANQVWTRTRTSSTSLLFSTHTWQVSLDVLVLAEPHLCIFNFLNKCRNWTRTSVRISLGGHL